MSVPRLARMVAIAVLVGVAVSHVRWMIADWNLHDMNVYWDAAQRLRSGDSLYADGANTFHAYRYAPWFAAAWIPLTYLPKAFVGFAWSTVLLAASAAVLWPLLRMRTTPALLLVVMMLPLLVPMASGGNVQPLMVAALLYGLPRRWGPFWVGLAASLKVAPLLLVLVYMGRREWKNAALTIGIAGALLAPALLMGLSPTTVDPGPVASLPAVSPVLYVAATVLAITAAAWVSARRPAFGALAAATAALIALPRLFLSDVTILLAGTPLRKPTDSTGERASERREEG